MMSIRCASHREAPRKLLEAIGTAQPGSLVAGLESLRIQVEDDEDRLATVYRHLDYPDFEALVDYAPAQIL